MRYRSEVDGLRAVAVVPVILNHAEFSLFSGGYVGVDIFFVISGFLISSIIYSEAERGSFSLLRFYERRVRRIVPALVVVTLASFVPAHFLMMPDGYENFAQSVVATLLFSNNVLLTLTTGYWELASQFKPLLHTWSLGVEEQFYILYPLLVVLVLKLRKNWFPIVLLAGICVSLALSIALTKAQPNASFYLLHTRAWELLLGALAGYYQQQASSRHGNVLSLFGLALIVLAIFGYGEDIPYPYYYAVAPCLGTALILMFATERTFAGRLLANKAFVGIGLVSYSAYLWHQPLFSFARIASISEPDAWLYALLTVLNLALAYLTWRYVEKPFRNAALFSGKQIFVGAALASLALVAVGLGVYRTAGLPERVPGIGLGHDRFIAYNERVFRFKADSFLPDERPNILVVGNSTARDLVNVMIESGLFSNDEIIYRDDIDLCAANITQQAHAGLLAMADSIVMAANWKHDSRCSRLPLDEPSLAGKPFVLVGPKHFGYNLNAYVGVPIEDRFKIRAVLLADTHVTAGKYASLVPTEQYVDVIRSMNERFGGVPVFNESGEILSVDCVHLTKAGAVFFSRFLFDDSAWAPVLALRTARAGNELAHPHAAERAAAGMSP